MDDTEKEKIRKQILNKKIYNTRKYKKWRIGIFRRDRYKCQFPGCGKVGGSIQAHHIKPKFKYPEKIFEKDNGITLCWDCHQKLHASEQVEKYAIKFRRLAKANKPRPKIVRRINVKIKRN